MKDETLAVHAGYTTDPTTKAVAVPIYQTVAYEFDNAQHGADLFNLVVPGNIYTRIMNPTNDVLEQRVAALEGGLAGLALSSGSAATNYSILTIANAGSNIVSVPLLYGGTYTLFAHQLPSQGIEVRFARDDSAAALGALIDDKTAAVFCETIGNPAGNIPDLEAITAMAHKKGVPVIVDNTVPTPVLMKPIQFGADIVVHSLTKYMGGHGNSIGGIIVDSGKFPWAEHKARFPMLNNPEPAYHGVVYTEALGPAAYIGRDPDGAAPEHRLLDEPVQCVPLPAGDRDAAVADGASRLERDGGGESPREAFRREVGQLRWLEVLAVLPAVAEVHEGSPVSAVDVRHQGRFRGGREVLRRAQDVQAARQHRRRQVAGRAPGVDHAPSAHRG